MKRQEGLRMTKQDEQSTVPQRDERRDEHPNSGLSIGVSGPPKTNHNTYPKPQTAQEVRTVPCSLCDRPAKEAGHRKRKQTRTTQTRLRRPLGW